MRIGYLRISKTDGSQHFDLQRDALLAAGVEPQHLYEDRHSIPPRRPASWCSASSRPWRSSSGS